MGRHIDGVGNQTMSLSKNQVAAKRFLSLPFRLSFFDTAEPLLVLLCNVYTYTTTRPQWNPCLFVLSTNPHVVKKKACP